jgi:diguanylate cyclase (GGDEF)-like protein/putative nucleotidyltransferase with HDIG domain
MTRIFEILGMGAEKHNIGHLPLGAKLYVTALSAAAVAVLAYSVAIWQSAGMGQFLLYLLCGILCSNMKVCLPGITGTLSVNSLFILASATELPLPQAVAVGCTSGIAQLFWTARKRPQNIQILFTFASMAISSALTCALFRAQWLIGGASSRLFWASILYFLLNTGALGLIISLTEGKEFCRLWRNNFLWTAPQYLVAGALAGLLHVWNQYAGWHSAVMVFPPIYLVYYSYRLYLGRLEEEKRHVGEMGDLHLRTIRALALAIDARDGNTHGHLRRVQVYAREMARELGLPENERRALDAAALLHDIGKLAVPEYIISKPGKLTPEEFEKMKVHPLVGAEILDSVQFPYPVVPIVRAHHEKWDGSGYPFGLKGEDIPIGARIVSAVDCLDAMSSDRQYRRALPLQEAMRRVKAESGKSFDPRVVEVLERRYAEFELLAYARTPDHALLSMDVRVDNGGGPAAGFEPSTTAPVSSNAGFVTSIAAARQEFQTLLELTNDLGNSLRVDETLSLLTARLKALIPYDGVAIYTVRDGCLATQYAAGDDAALFSSLAIPLGEGISGWVTQNNKPIVNGNPSVEPGYLNDQTKFSIHRSALSVPLPGITGVIGALTLYHRDAGAFTRDHLRVLLAISSKAGLTIENALRFVQAEETATTDGLTGLPNARSLFLRLDAAVESARQTGSSLAVLVTDMDGFKQVNDQYGHSAGNKVLEKTAHAFRETIREGDYAARMGGDEFVMLMRGAQKEVIRERAGILNELVAQIGRQVCNADFLRLSVGAAYYPEDAGNAEELLAIADSRMYEVKRRHHGEGSSVENMVALARAVAERRSTEQPLS